MRCFFLVLEAFEFRGFSMLHHRLLAPSEHLLFHRSMDVHWTLIPCAPTMRLTDKDVKQYHIDLLGIQKVEVLHFTIKDCFSDTSKGNKAIP